VLIASNIALPSCKAFSFKEHEEMETLDQWFSNSLLPQNPFSNEEY
jgi:hypothetical protein